MYGALGIPTPQRYGPLLQDLLSQVGAHNEQFPKYNSVMGAEKGYFYSKGSGQIPLHPPQEVNVE